jgi:hypothetical protein
MQCAAGCLMAEAEYKPTFEHRDWADLTGAGDVTGEHRGLINDLQEVHDHTDPEQWSTHLHKVAKNHNLQFNG